MALDPFIGQIEFFGGTFAPLAYASCDGQLLAVSSNDALFSLLGTIYGGDGRTTFSLPDLRGRVAVHFGNGAGLSSIRLGQKSGTDQVTLNRNNLPSHRHSGQINLANGLGTTDTGNGLYLAADATPHKMYTPTAGTEAKTTANDVLQLSSAGGSSPFSIRSPFGVSRAIIALSGIYPSRN